MIDIPAFVVYPMDIRHLPNAKGSYLLVLYLNTGRAIEIGRTGWSDFPPGYYLYAGSALGSGGIKARLGRHLSLSSKRRWHIDYLKEYTQVTAYAWVVHDLPRECDWIQALATLSAAIFPAKGFGARDCRRGCPAHMVHFRDWIGVVNALESIKTYEIGLAVDLEIEVLDNPNTLC